MALSVRKPEGEMQDDSKVVDKDTAAAAAAKTEGTQKTQETKQAQSADTGAQAADTPKAGEADAGAGQVLEGELVSDTADQPGGDANETETVSEAAAEAANATADVDPQPETEARPEAGQRSEARSLVNTSENTRVALPKNAGGAAHNVFKDMIAKLAESGQEGLEFGFGVFPMLSLDKGDWKLGDEDLKDDTFRGVALSSSPKFAYRTTNVSDKDSEVVFADTDREHTDANSAVSAKLAEWKSKFPDSGWEVKKYQNVYFYLTEFPAKPEMEGQIVVLSVAPTSVKNYTNACIMASGKGYDMHECVTEVRVGDKINGDYSYYPWAFKVVGSCKKLGVEVKFGTERDEDF